jgi:flavin reductase (DIM6/NTAB) family NADH-FMN oxidoreductase RutF
MQQLAEGLRQIDAALRLVDREIWVVTAAEGERRGGLVATWVSAASIDASRPVLLVGLAPNHFTTELVQASKAFGAHLLREDQGELAWNFANGSGRSRDKLAGLAVERKEGGSPILADCAAWFDCRVFARYDAGDRVFFWGDVLAGGYCNSHAAREGDITRSVMTTMGDITRSVMTTMCEQAFFRGLSEEQRQVLIADKAADAAKNRPFHESWRLTNPW